jgi:hypothetical protein
VSSAARSGILPTSMVTVKSSLVSGTTVIPSRNNNSFSHINAGSGGTPRRGAKYSLPQNSVSSSVDLIEGLTVPRKMPTSHLQNRRNCLELIRSNFTTCPRPSISNILIVFKTHCDSHRPDPQVPIEVCVFSWSLCRF